MAETNHAKVPVRVVRVMPESHQALLFDRSRATHVLVEVGGQIDGYTVDAIDEDEVILSLGGAQVVLAAPARASRRRDHDPLAVHARSVAARQPDTSAAAPVDPYGEPAVRVVEAPGSAGSPGDRTPGVSRAIEAGDGGVRVAVAPGGSTPSAEGPAEGLPSDTHIRVAEAPSGEPPAPSPSPSTAAPIAPAAAPIAPAPTPTAPAPTSPSVAPAPADERAPAVRAVSAAAPDQKTVDARAMADLLSTDHGRRAPRMPSAPSGASPSVTSVAPASDIRTTTAATTGTIVLGRGEVDGALADFAKLTTAVHGSFSAAGIVLDHVTDGTIFQHAGLRSGDVITAVDGVRLRSLDDAANLYARASTARALTAQIVRGGAAMTIHVTIQ